MVKAIHPQGNGFQTDGLDGAAGEDEEEEEQKRGILPDEGGQEMTGGIQLAVTELAEDDGGDKEDAPNQQAARGQGNVERRLRVANED